MPTNVRLRLNGLLVLDAKGGQRVGKVGILHAPPPPANPRMRHVLTIKVGRVLEGTAVPVILTRPDIRPRLTLEITGGLHPTIAVRDPTPVNRHQPAMHPESSRWFVDLENSELFNGRIGSNGRFESVLTFNDGGQVFTAERPNESILEIKRPGDADYRRFGRVALHLGVDFLGATRAVFKNGGQTVFDSQQEPGTNYNIDISHDAPEHPPTVEDANHYYTVLAPSLPANQRILFRSRSEAQLLRERLSAAKLGRDNELVKRLEADIDVLENLLGPPAGPEAACFTAVLGLTDL